MLTKKSFFIIAGPLLLVLFIDGMGLGLVFPLLNALVMDPHSQFLPTNWSAATRNFSFGAIIGVYMLCWFFGASFLGDLSDQIGRRKSLLICLIGAFLGYLASAIAIPLHSLALLVLGRIVAGFTAGSQPIAQAAIVDLSAPEEKVRNIGFVLLAISLGFIIGPFIGGILSQKSLVSWFDYDTPFYFASIISFINMIFLWWLFKETFTRTSKIQIKPHRAIEVLISAFQNKNVRAMSIIFLIMIIGWSSYYSFISMFLLRRYGLNEMDVSLFMSLMGAGFAIGNGFLSDFCAKRFALKKLTVTMLLLCAVSILFSVAINHVWSPWIFALPVTMTISVAYAVLLAIFSNQVSPAEQGWVMGVSGAIMAFSFGLNCFVTGLFANLSASLPMYLAAFFIAVSGIALFIYQPKIEHPEF